MRKRIKIALSLHRDFMQGLYQILSGGNINLEIQDQ